MGTPGRAAPLRALLLDLDDTILDDRGSTRGAWSVVAELVVERHPDLAYDAVIEAIARSTRWFWSDPERERRGRLDLPAARTEIVRGALAQLDRAGDALSAEGSRRYTAYRERSYRLFDGALAVLERLRRAVPRLALVTNGAADPQRGKIERFGLAPYFDHIQIEGEFGLGKPDRRVYEHTLRAVGASPAESMMVGDNYCADVLGPLELGMEAVWIDVEGRGRPPVDPPRPHAIIRSLVELAELIERDARRIDVNG